MIVRAPRKPGFTILDNALLRDANLSFRARGLLAFVLSHTDGWSTDSVALSKKAKEGREAIRSALRELEVVGYIARVKTQGERGRWSTTTYVFDSPLPVEGREEALAARLGLPTRDANELSTGSDDDDDHNDGSLDQPFDGPAFAQVAPAPENPSPVDSPAPRNPAVGGLGGKRQKTTTENGGAGVVSQPQDARPAEVAPSRSNDTDEHGPVTPICPAHRDVANPPPCPRCGQWRERFEKAERSRERARRKAETEAAIQRDRAAKAKAARDVHAAAERARRALRDAARAPEAEGQ